MVLPIAIFLSLCWYGYTYVDATSQENLVFLGKYIEIPLETFLLLTLIILSKFLTKCIKIESSKLSSKEYLQCLGAFVMAFIFYPNRFYKTRKLCMLIGRWKNESFELKVFCTMRLTCKCITGVYFKMPSLFKIIVKSMLYLN